MPVRGVVRTKAGSQWALNSIGWNSGEAFFLTLDGSGRARHFQTIEAVHQECFWLGISPDQTLLVDDAFFYDRYVYERADGSTAAVAASAATASAAGAGVFAVVMVALLWVGLELGLRNDWYSITQWQIAAIVGVVVVLAALVSAFTTTQGAAVLRAIHRRRPDVYRGAHDRRPA